MERAALTDSHTPMSAKLALHISRVTSETPICRALSRYCMIFLIWEELTRRRASGSGRTGWAQANSGLSTSTGMS